MKKSYILILLLFICFNLKAQVKGSVVDSENKAIEYFHAVLLSPVDSSIVQGGAFINGMFEFHKVKSGSYSLKLSSVGYQTHLISIQKTEEEENLDIIELESLNLEEVRVVAIRPSFRIEKNKFIMQVANSGLSDVGNSIDVLRQTPMIVIDSEDNLTVAGKDNVLIFVDGRKIYSNQELQMISSSNIKKIEVITNPSAKYEASGKSVVNIVTKQQQFLNVISSQVKSDVSVGRKIWARENIILGYKNNKVNVFVNYGYNHGKQKSYESFIREVTPTLTNRTITDYTTSYLSVQNTHEYRAGLNYKINPKHRLGIQINGWFDEGKLSTFTVNKYLIDDLSGKTVTESLNKPNSQFNTFNLSYDFLPDTIGQKLTMLLDYSKSKSDSDEKINETEGNQYKNNHINNESNYDIYATKLDYHFPILSLDASIDVGGKYSKVVDRSKSLFHTLIDEKWQEQDRYTNLHNFDEQYVAFYVEFNKKVQKFNFNVGIRWEHINSNGDNGNISIIDTSYSKLFPSASVNYKFNEKISFILNYSKKIRRPSYNSLNPTIIYVDKYFYRIGNPLLTPEISDVFEFSSTINRHLTLNFGYQYHDNPINFSFYQDQQNPNITMLTTENFKQKESFFLNASYSYSSESGKFSMQNTIGYKKPKMKIHDHGETRTLTEPFYYFQQSCNVVLPKKISLYSNFLFYHLGENDIFSYKSISNFSVGLRTNFYNEKLLINAYVSDAFDIMTWKKSTSINTMTMDHKYDSDNTYIKISLTYNFGSFKPKLKTRSGNKEEQNRL